MNRPATTPEPATEIESSAGTATEPSRCPVWCTLPVGHPWDSQHDDGRESRGHQGPSFGGYVFTGAREFSDAAGIQVYEISVASEVERDVVTSAQAVELASHLLAATQWIEDRQRREPGDT